MNDSATLAEKIMNTMQKDLGYLVSSDFGVKPKTDEDAYAWGELSKHLNYPDRCSQCGHEN